MPVPFMMAGDVTPEAVVMNAAGEFDKEDFLNYIYFKESSSGKNPGKGGGYEITPIGYREALNFNPTLKRFTYDNVVRDDTIGRRFADTLLFKAAPHYASHYGYEDNPQTKIGFFNWGIGKMREHDFDLGQSPPITQKYLKDYELWQQKKLP